MARPTPRRSRTLTHQCCLNHGTRRQKHTSSWPNLCSDVCNHLFTLSAAASTTLLHESGRRHWNITKEGSSDGQEAHTFRALSLASNSVNLEEPQQWQHWLLMHPFPRVAS
eukprot:4219933-Amphidinium_carterae.1